MKMDDFIDVLQAVVTDSYPNLELHIFRDRSQCSVASGVVFVKGAFAIDVAEWTDNDSKGKIVLVKTRILDMLYSIKEHINDDIERIENA